MGGAPLEPQVVAAPELFPHIRIVMGMVIGLGVARLLSGVARIVQYPKRSSLYFVHLAWVASVLLMLVSFWWWEFGLYQVETWTFGKYLFVISYAVVLFLLCALLFPEGMEDYRNYAEFFHDRRGWFFGTLAATYVMDIADTLIKGNDYLVSFGPEYIIRTPLIILLCIIAAIVQNKPFHVAFVIFKLGYQIYWISWHFNVIA